MPAIKPTQGSGVRVVSRAKTSHASTLCSCRMPTAWASFSFTILKSEVIGSAPLTLKMMNYTLTRHRAARSSEHNLYEKVYAPGAIKWSIMWRRFPSITCGRYHDEKSHGRSSGLIDYVRSNTGHWADHGRLPRHTNRRAGRIRPDGF